MQIEDLTSIISTQDNTNYVIYITYFELILKSVVGFPEKRAYLL